MNAQTPVMRLAKKTSAQQRRRRRPQQLPGGGGLEDRGQAEGLKLRPAEAGQCLFRDQLDARPANGVWGDPLRARELEGERMSAATRRNFRPPRASHAEGSQDLLGFGRREVVQG